MRTRRTLSREKQYRVFSAPIEISVRTTVLNYPPRSKYSRKVKVFIIFNQFTRTVLIGERQRHD